MKKCFHKISSFCLALIVLLSTVSFTVDSHYCGDTLVDSSLFGHVETCGMEIQQSKAFSSECNISKKDCCNDVHVTVKGQETYKTSFDKLEKSQQLFVAAFIHTYILLFVEPQTDFNSYKDYTPPPLVRDVQVLDQIFLI
ncbi:HYC_CC_PP family protein [Flavobacterium sp. C4GT6]|uniref:HYC_CC_PP family protein n=1 Tax=Flavobacterium sp. C4GT6 TaxID=3103818 RepID=UPI002ED2A572